MNELLQWSPIATLVVVITALIGQVLRGGNGDGCATQAATQAATAITMSALKEAISHLSTTLERMDANYQNHERRLVTIEVACRMRHVERREEVRDAGGV